jgi:hypothetical protein
MLTLFFGICVPAGFATIDSTGNVEASISKQKAKANDFICEPRLTLTDLISPKNLLVFNITFQLQKAIADYSIVPNRRPCYVQLASTSLQTEHKKTKCPHANPAERYSPHKISAARAKNLNKKTHTTKTQHTKPTPNLTSLQANVAVPLSLRTPCSRGLKPETANSASCSVT